MSQVPAVWRYAGSAVGADRDMLVSLQLVRPQRPRGITMCRRLFSWVRMEDEMHG